MRPNVEESEPLSPKFNHWTIIMARSLEPGRWLTAFWPKLAIFSKSWSFSAYVTNWLTSFCRFRTFLTMSFFLFYGKAAFGGARSCLWAINTKIYSHILATIQRRIQPSLASPRSYLKQFKANGFGLTSLVNDQQLVHPKLYFNCY